MFVDCNYIFPFSHPITLGSSTELFYTLLEVRPRGSRHYDVVKGAHPLVVVGFEPRTSVLPLDQLASEDLLFMQNHQQTLVGQA